MGRPKIARKSTWVDMTAFVDVSFLLLSFFILTTKFKPPEAIQVMMPSSVSSKAAEEKDQVLVTISNEGKVFLSFSEPERARDVAEEAAKLAGIKLSASDIAKAEKTEFFGSPIEQLPSYLNIPKEQLKGDKLPGIPVLDSTNNQLSTWMLAAFNVFHGEKMNLMVKGDNAAKYPVFKQVMEAFKKNEFLKFQIITNQEQIPAGSDYDKKNRAKQ